MKDHNLGARNGGGGAKERRDIGQETSKMIEKGQR